MRIRHLWFPLIFLVLSTGARADCGNFFTAVTDPAEVCFRRALAIDSRLATAHHGLGLHHLRHQQHALAARCFESAV